MHVVHKSEIHSSFFFKPRLLCLAQGDLQAPSDVSVTSLPGLLAFWFGLILCFPWVSPEISHFSTEPYYQDSFLVTLLC